MVNPQETAMKNLANARAAGLLLQVALALASPVLNAQDSEETFLSDYSRLKPSPDNPFEEVYIAPGALERASKYTAIMIDQPELFVHPDSKYKGMKPDDMKIVADALRDAVTAELKDSYKIVDAPGADVLYVRLAVGDLMLKKKKRSILAYTPAGALIKAARDLTKEVTDKVDVASFVVEGEVQDSVSGEQLAALTMSRGSLSTKDSGAAPTWDELSGLFGTIGKRLRCRLDNSKRPEAEQARCGAIGLASAE
jgi:Protein of unknown function (DUF3313)